MEDGVEVYLKKWCRPGKPKAIVQLSHGMVEHIERYKEFADFLVEQHIFVYGHDHRGHGNTGKRQGLLGYFAETDGFTKVVQDLHRITEIVKQEHPDTPIILFGHSMGSFIARVYLQKYADDIDGIILSGTGYVPTSTATIGKRMAAMLPPEETSGLMNRMTFGNYNKRIKNKQTPFDWLTRDTEAIKGYMDDPDTGFIPTARFFYDLMSGLITMNDHKRNRSIRKGLPMLLVSGDADPVGNYEKGIWKTAEMYRQSGMTRITVMLFTDGRHELLNEINKDEVFAAIYSWLQKRLP
jgi:alpha-beta hydrolase superfamily lysophospholipase